MSKQELDKLKESIAQLPEKDPANFITFLDEKYVAAANFSDEEIKSIDKFLNNYSSGDYKAIPLICSGSLCIYSGLCPLVAMKRPPLKSPCPFESYFVKKWENEYIVSLEADWDDKIERSLIMDLVEIDILNMRANTMLATEGFIMENVVGIDPETGDPLMHKEEHVAIKLKDRVKARRDRILKSMIATRDAKAKLITSMKDDVSSYSSKLREKAEKIYGSHDAEIIDDLKLKEINNE